MVGVAIEVSAFNEWGQICVGRALAGMGVGATSGLVPVFQAEASPPALRGMITGSFQLNVTLGIFLVNCTTYGMSKHTGDITYRLPVGLALIWSGLLLIGFILSPESPAYLAGRGDWEKARINLAKLRDLPADDEEITLELEEMRIAKEEEAKLGEARYAEVFSNKDRIAWRTMIGCLIQACQQLSGINFYFSYGSVFARYAGIDDVFIFIIILSAVNVAMSFPGILAVDKMGRRSVLLIGCLVMGVSQVIVGAVSTALPGQAQAGKSLIAFSAIFVAGFASTIGPVAWVVAAEVFPQRLAAKCVTLATATNWGVNTVITFVAPIIQQKIGTKITFIWAGFLIGSAVFIYLCVPETKGLSIVEVDSLFLSKTPAWRSKSFIENQGAQEAMAQEKRGSDEQHEKALDSVATSARTSAEV
jgi:sugar porter (SP) family MFS transporter